jgi:hypothetical protein
MERPVAAQQLCPQIARDWQACESAAEKTLLKRFPSRFKRSGPTLVVRFANNTEETFVNGEIERGREETSRDYVLIGYQPRSGFAVLRRWFYEDSTVDLVSMKTGKHMDIVDAPVFSPDETHVAVAKEEGFGPNTLAVYRVTADDAIQEFLDEASGRSVQNLKWLGNDTLSFVEHTYNPPRAKPRVLKKETGPTKSVTWKVR